MQVVPEQQPEQSLPEQVPPHPSADPGHFPEQLGVQTVEQLPLIQSSLPLQVSHDSPFVPQYVSEFPFSQVVPLQQPEQPLPEQVPPQPSDAPGHFPEQLGVQTVEQLPLRQSSFPLQVSHDSPFVPQ